MAIFDEPSKKPLPSDTTLEDHRSAVIKGTLASIPIVGNVLAEELGLVLVPPLTQRRDAWFEDLARRLRELEESIVGFHFDELGRNKQFVSATIQATQAALKTHRTEKLEALRNAILNIAIGRSTIDADEQTMFLRYIDEFTPWHIRILKFLDNPSVFIPEKQRTDPRFHAQGGSRAQILHQAYPELSNRQDFYDPIVHDLRGSSLITGDVPNLLHGMTSGNGLMSVSTTSTGQRFLKFIEEPKA